MSTDLTRRTFIKGSAAVIGVALLPFPALKLADLPKTEMVWLRVTLDVDTGTQITYHSWDPPDTSPDRVRWEQDPDPEWTIEADDQIAGDIEIKVAITADDWSATKDSRPLVSGPSWRLRGPTPTSGQLHGAWIYDEGDLITAADFR